MPRVGGSPAVPAVTSPLRRGFAGAVTRKAPRDRRGASCPRQSETAPRCAGLRALEAQEIHFTLTAS